MISRGSKSETPSWNPFSETNLHAVWNPTRKKKTWNERCSRRLLFLCLMYVYPWLKWHTRVSLTYAALVYVCLWHTPVKGRCPPLYKLHIKYGSLNLPFVSGVPQKATPLHAICFVIGLRPNLKGFGLRSRGSQSETPGWNSLFWRSTPARTLRAHSSFQTGQVIHVLASKRGWPAMQALPIWIPDVRRLLVSVLSPSPGFQAFVLSGFHFFLTIRFSGFRISGFQTARISGFQAFRLSGAFKGFQTSRLSRF